jgi:hypothetical protein
LKTNKDKSQHGRKLQRIIKTYGLTNVITEPTRVANSSATLLDLILVSNKSKIIKAGTLDPAISDHKMIYAIVNLIKKREHPIIKTVKNYKYVDKSKFKSALQNVPWWVCDIFDDLDDVQSAWELLYKGVVDEYITERKVKVRQNSLPVG